MTALMPEGPVREEVAEGSGLRTRRTRTVAVIGVLGVAVAAVVVAGGALRPAAELTDLLAQRRPPGWAHPFGTDWLGRDMLARTLVGLRTSLLVGMGAAGISAAIALVLAGVSTLGRWADAVVGWLVDLFLALPHLILILLIAFALGGGLQAVIVAVAVTHWPSLTRVLRAEARRVMSSDYVRIARRMGKGGAWIMTRHLGRHLFGHFTVGMVLLFPHAILHEAGLSFLGMGLSPHSPAIGVILADSMRYLSGGAWWLALLPGFALLVLVKTVDVIGEQVRALTDPRSVHE